LGLLGVQAYGTSFQEVLQRVRTPEGAQQEP